MSPWMILLMVSRPLPPPRWQPPCHQITRGGNKKRCAPRLRRSPQKVARLPKRCWPRCWDGPYARAVTCPTRVCPPPMLVRRTGLPLPTPRHSYGHRTYHPPFTRLGTRILPRHSSLPMWKSHPYRRRRRRHTSRPRPASSEPACCLLRPASTFCTLCLSALSITWTGSLTRNHDLKKKKKKERKNYNWKLARKNISIKAIWSCQMENRKKKKVNKKIKIKKRLDGFNE